MSSSSEGVFIFFWLELKANYLVKVMNWKLLQVQAEKISVEEDMHRPYGFFVRNA